jgi:EAL domain-containing protein (putative c-di-GMP-specific phosphodiesterase class I)
VAEETGLIVPLGEWVLREACRQSAQWRHERGAYGPPVAVNLSPRQLTDPAFPGLVAAALAEFDLPPEQLLVEMTESALLDDAEAAQYALAALKGMGILIALDDFGTGYSSLSFLRRFPVDIVKIDRSFVDGLGRNQEDTAIVSAIISMARSLGLMTVAEGVEQADQLEHLRLLGCDAAQGYHLGRPAPAEVVVDISC